MSDEYSFYTPKTALGASTRAGNADCVNLLLKAAADVNLSTHDQTPLIHSISHGSADCVKALLDGNADINCTMDICQSEKFSYALD